MTSAVSVRLKGYASERMYHDCTVRIEISVTSLRVSVWHHSASHESPLNIFVLTSNTQTMLTLKWNKTHG